LQRFERLASTVAKRTVSPVSVDELVLDLHFDAPIPADDLSRLAIEGKEVATHPNNRPLAIIGGSGTRRACA
jgi:hypothetical protein